MLKKVNKPEKVNPLQKIKERKWVDRESRLARNDGIRRMMRKD